jgi:hypothetical protein
MVKKKIELDFPAFQSNPSDPDDSIKEAAYHEEIVREKYPECFTEVEAEAEAEIE